jgi:hypothetical protein
MLGTKTFSIPVTYAVGADGCPDPTLNVYDPAIAEVAIAPEIKSPSGSAFFKFFNINFPPLMLKV